MDRESVEVVGPALVEREQVQTAVSHQEGLVFRRASKRDTTRGCCIKEFIEHVSSWIAEREREWLKRGSSPVLQSKRAESPSGFWACSNLRKTVIESPFRGRMLWH